MTDKSYEVGYGKPPQHTRFKAGVSANPSGRSRRTPTLLEEFARELDVRVQVQEGGRKRRYTKRQLITKQVVNGAVKGDRASLRFIQMIQTALDSKVLETTETMSPRERSAVDRAIFDAIASTMAAPTAPDDDAGSQGGGEAAG